MQAVAKIIASADVMKNLVAGKMDSVAFASWIAPCDFSVCNCLLEVVALNQFSADFIRRSYLSVIESVARDFGLGVNLTVRGAVAVKPCNDNEIKTFIPAALPKNENDFSGFIVTDENSFAVSAAKKLASGSASFSPLFIYGAAGCGKSLLAGCINGASAGRTIMMTGEQFVSEFVRAMNDKSIFAFKDFCRNCDTFILDDVQFLGGKRASADEFLSLAVDLIKQNKNLVLVSNAAPGSLGGFDRRAQSVFASGLVVDLVAPNKKVKKAMLCRAGVDMDVAEFIASRTSGDGHVINGVAKKMNAYKELMNERVTAQVAEKLLVDVLEKRKTPAGMVKMMCENLGVSYDAICSSGRSRMVVRARQMMMKALKVATSLSLSEIGRLIGDRDHATVLYGIGQVEKMLGCDLVMSSELQGLVEICR